MTKNVSLPYDWAGHKDRQKNRIEQNEKFKDHSKVSERQIIEIGHILFKLVDCEVETILFSERSNGALFKRLKKANKQATFGVRVDDERERKFQSELSEVNWPFESSSIVTCYRYMRRPRAHGKCANSADEPDWVKDSQESR